MNNQDIATLYEYNAWATGRTLDACASLTSEQFLKVLGNSFPSVRDTLAHILNAEWLWLKRWQGESPRAGLPATDFPTVDSVRDGFARVEADRRRFLSAVPEASLAEPFTYHDLQGVERQLTLVAALQHVVNHGTYHRGQVTTMLRQLGAVPVSTDLSRFYMEAKG